MTHELGPIDRIELELGIAEATLAADADLQVAHAGDRAVIAEGEMAAAVTDQDRVAAYLRAEQAYLEAIQARSADSRADWELEKMTKPEIAE